MSKLYEKNERMTPLGHELDELATNVLRDLLVRVCQRGITVREALGFLHSELENVGLTKILDDDRDREK